MKSSVIPPLSAGRYILNILVSRGRVQEMSVAEKGDRRSPSQPSPFSLYVHTHTNTQCPIKPLCFNSSFNLTTNICRLSHSSQALFCNVFSSLYGTVYICSINCCYQKAPSMLHTGIGE